MEGKPDSRQTDRQTDTARHRTETANRKKLQSVHYLPRTWDYCSDIQLVHGGRVA